MINRKNGQRKSSVERKMSHYGISKSEASAHPEKYPLPKRRLKNRRQTE